MLVALSVATISSSIFSSTLPRNRPQGTPAEARFEGPELVLERDDLLKAKDGFPGFRITLVNAGRQDLVLNIGMLVANGNKQYASAIELLLTDPKGKNGGFPLETRAPLADASIRLFCRCQRERDSRCLSILMTIGRFAR
jgi:hypothetical protein